MQHRPLRIFSFAASLIVLTAIALAHAETSAAAAADQPPRIADIPELAGLAKRWTAALSSLEVPGFSIAIVKDGRVLALDGFGARNVKGEPATIDTCYYIASATKPFTAMAACALAGEGKLDLDAPVKKYLPQLQLPDAHLTETITVRDLLCHRHGLNCGPIVHRDAYTGQITDDLYFQLLREATIAHQVRYSNVHFTLAGRVIEAISGEKWQDYLRQSIFEPAGMQHTTAYASEMYGFADHAEPMILIDGTWTRSPLVKTDRTMHAAGGMGATARDSARWLLLNLNRGQIDGKRILPEPLAREYLTRQSEHPQPEGRIRIEEGFALGWGVGKYREPTRPYFFHGGGYRGAASYFCFLPEEGIGVAVLANSDNGGAIATIASIDVLDRLLGIKDQPDLLPTYQEQAQQRRAEMNASMTRGVNPASAPDGLSQPAERYVGIYSNAVTGDLEVYLNDHAELAARMGDLPFTLLSRGRDQFTAMVVPGMAGPGRFEVTGEAVTVVTLELADVVRRFERKR